MVIYQVEFYKGDKLLLAKAWDLGLDSAKQHASGMLKPYEATTSRILDPKRRVVFSYPVPPEA